MGSVPVGDLEFLRGFPKFLGFGREPCGASPLSGVLREKRKELGMASSRLAGKKGVGGVLDTKKAMAMKNHSDAERRRRERINGHLTVLKKMIPCANKLDKAALLAEVINHVKKLKRNAVEIAKGYIIPSDVDEVLVEVDKNVMSAGKLVIKASLCCEDRPEVLANLSQTLQDLHLRTIGAEISTLGGRIKNVLVMTSEVNAISVDKHLLAASIHHALKSLLDQVNSQIDFLPRTEFSNKRRKMSPFESSNSSSS